MTVILRIVRLFIIVAIVAGNLMPHAAMAARMTPGGGVFHEPDRHDHGGRDHGVDGAAIAKAVDHRCASNADSDPQGDCCAPATPTHAGGGHGILCCGFVVAEMSLPARESQPGRLHPGPMVSALDRSPIPDVPPPRN